MTTETMLRGQGLTETVDGAVEALRDFVAATSDIRRWAQMHMDGRPEVRCSGPWPQPGLIKEECDKLREVYRKHAETLARISTAPSEPGQPLGLVSTEGLGLAPERCADCRTPNACSDGNCLEAYIKRRIENERDCRTCMHWTPHHRSDVMHCSAALRCVAGSSYQRQGVVQLWEAVPIEPTPF